MIIYSEHKSPGEVKDFTYDWNDALADGEDVATLTVTLVDAAGCTQPHVASHAGGVTRVWLAGGTAGARCVFLVSITTDASPARTLEEAFGVDIVAPQTEPTDADGIRADLVVLRAARTKLAAGQRVDEVGRDGRRMVYGKVTLDALNTLIRQRESDLLNAEAIETGRPRRRPIVLGYS